MSRANPVPDLRLLPPVLAGWLATRFGLTHAPATTFGASAAVAALGIVALSKGSNGTKARSEERRVGKECA